MRKIKLFFIRKIKGLFLLLNLHYLFGWLNPILGNLYYLNKFSKWHKKIKKPEFDDFYTFKFKRDGRYEIYDYILKKEMLSEEINYLEFGVAYGNTFRWWAGHNKNMNSRFYGFDTFEGLPEDWHLYKKGEMSPESIPQIADDRVFFYKGLFQETLFDFLKNFQDDKRKVINIDADLYTSTLFVLTTIAPFLKGGDIILFDEFGVPFHEFKAFTEFVNSFYIKYEVIASINNYFQIAIKIQ